MTHGVQATLPAVDRRYPGFLRIGTPHTMGSSVMHGRFRTDPALRAEFMTMTGPRG